MLDLTICYYTVNVVSRHFFRNTWKQLIKACNGLPVIAVSQIPIPASEQVRNIVVKLPRSHLNIYRQALIGAKNAETEYIALCEDDVLYSPEHFKYRPMSGKFAYNLGAWSIFTWSKIPTFTHKATVRRNLNSLICERELFIEAMEERFARWPDDSKIDKGLWAEPGKYEKYLGVTERETEEFYTNPPNIIFSHEAELSFSNLGTRKRLGEFRAYDIPHWGKAEGIVNLYK